MNIIIKAFLLSLLLSTSITAPVQPVVDVQPIRKPEKLESVVVCIRKQEEIAKDKNSSTITQKKNSAEFTLTAYCGCTACCGEGGAITATGTTPKQGQTIAVDPDIIPYGTTVYINGHEYIAEDCGGAIKGNHIDIYFDSHADALAFGKQTATVYW